MPLDMEVGLSPGDFELDEDPAPSPKRGGAPNFWPTSIVAKQLCDQDATWYGGRPHPTRHCVRWGLSSRPLKGHSPQFSANVHCGQTAGWTKMALGMEVSLGPGDFVFDGDPGPPRKKGTATPTQFLAHVYCGEMAGWIKMPLGTEVKLSRRRCVR